MNRNGYMMTLVKSMKSARLFLFAILWVSFATAYAESPIAANDVVWHSLGTNENDSMPLGNGDIALNAWTEQNGDILLLIAKADAWSENGQLLKLGRVRVSLSPNPFTNSTAFAQILKLGTGALEIRAGKDSVHIWVDANHPVIHLTSQTAIPVNLRATSENWRTKQDHLDSKIFGRSIFAFWEWNGIPGGLTFDPDTIFPARDNRVSWCHFNSRSLYPLVFEKEHLKDLLPKYPDPLLNRCFGVTMKGKNLASSDDQTLKSSKASRSQQLDLYALTEQVGSADVWRANLDKKISQVDAVKIGNAWKAHAQWWGQFWDRSWINVSGTPDAEKVSQGYAMQRYMTACAGRGAQPIKFNGSLFTVGHDMPMGAIGNDREHGPDYRRWNSCYWNQNTRHIYWPLIASGDYDLIAPWFDMYVQALPLARDRAQEYWHHDGAAFIETIWFWGLPNVNDFGWNNPKPDPQSSFMRYHIQGGIEVVAQMLDYYDNTQDADFARKSLLPFADAIVIFYDQHYPRDGDGKIRMSPANSIETYQVTAVNPTPDIAGLKAVLPRLLALSDKLTSNEERSLWAKVQNELPPIPMGTTAKGKLPPKGVGDTNGITVILPALSYGESKNIENPELYTVFPYRLYGIGKPELELAKNTFAARLFPEEKCWGQDGMEAALLGLTDVAKHSAIAALCSYGKQRFPWFWSQNMDYSPDMDNGGGGMMTLQLMLMQCDGKRIQLLPAWPKEWTADFKLHAPYQTTVEAHVENGKISRLKVTPEERAKDVVVVGP